MFVGFNFLESVGAIAIIGGIFYLLTKLSDKTQSLLGKVIMLSVWLITIVACLFSPILFLSNEINAGTVIISLYAFIAGIFLIKDFWKNRRNNYFSSKE